MIIRAARFLGREITELHTAAYILGASALISSVLALLRDRLFAHTFGAGELLDVYFAAFRVPDLIFVLIASLFSAYALIPVLAGQKEEGRWRYIDTVVLGFGVLIISVSAIAYITMPYVMPALFPKLASSVDASGLVLFSRILLLQPVLLGFSNILASITQTHRQYILYATAPILYNAGIIAGIFVLYPLMGVTGLVWGVILGALLHALIQLPSAMRKGFFIKLPHLGDIRDLQSTIKLSLPRTLALGMGQVVQMVLFIMAGMLGAGSIAVFMFSYNLQAVPLAIIGASYSMAAFPTLSKMVSEGSLSDFIEQVVAASRHILFWSVPAIALMIVLRAHIVRTVLGSGEFDWTDTRLTAASFAFFSIALAANALTLLIIRAYYAAGRSYLPLVVSLGTGALAIGLASLLLFSQAEWVSLFVESLLRVEDVPGTNMLLLPFAYAFAAIVGGITFVILFEHNFGGLVRGVSRIFWESVTAAGIGGTLSYGILTVLGGIGPATTLISVMYHGMFAGLVGLMGVGMVYWFFGSPECYETIAALRKRSKVIPVQSAEETLT
jgi:putative peptidoglycan lipid II flippase